MRPAYKNDWTEEQNELHKGGKTPVKKILRTLLCVMLTTALLLPALVYGAEAAAGGSGDTASASEASQPQNAPVTSTAGSTKDSAMPGWSRSANTSRPRAARSSWQTTAIIYRVMRLAF